MAVGRPRVFGGLLQNYKQNRLEFSEVRRPGLLGLAVVVLAPSDGAVLDEQGNDDITIGPAG